MTEEIKTTTIAQIDANGIYRGIVEINESDLTEAHVHLPHGCDLPAGQYRWDAEKKTFMPLQSGEEVPQQDPHALRAVAIGFITLHDQGLTLPPETLAWLDFYTGAMDFLGDFSEDTVALVHRYWSFRKGA